MLSSGGGGSWHPEQPGWPAPPPPAAGVSTVGRALLKTRQLSGCSCFCWKQQKSSSRCRRSAPSSSGLLSPGCSAHGHFGAASHKEQRPPCVGWWAKVHQRLWLECLLQHCLLSAHVPLSESKCKMPFKLAASLTCRQLAPSQPVAGPGAESNKKQPRARGKHRGLWQQPGDWWHSCWQSKAGIACACNQLRSTAVHAVPLAPA